MSPKKGCCFKTKPLLHPSSRKRRPGIDVVELPQLRLTFSTRGTPARLACDQHAGLYLTRGLDWEFPP